MIAKEKKEFESGLARFDETGQLEAIINMQGEVEEFVPAGESASVCE